MRKTLENLQAIVAECRFGDAGLDYAFSVQEIHGHFHLQAAYQDRCKVAGTVEVQTTRRWPLSPFMTKSEIVQTVFKCCITSMEHRCRESFQYRERRVFGPHFNVDDLWLLCSKGDEQREPAE